MKKELQKILLPKDEVYKEQWELFYHNNKFMIDNDIDALRIPAFHEVDFTSYLNGCSYGKWKKYTNVGTISLNLKVSGDFELVLVGYHLELGEVEKKIFGTTRYKVDKKTDIVIPYPDNKEQIVGFEIRTYSDCEIYGGSYVGDCEESDVKKVVLSLATTTCFKEEFIKSNVELIKKELLLEDSEVRENLYIQVVDNGRTLNKEDIEGYHVKLYPNKNSGGSGGFSRGMIESLRQDPQATHVLLMDDDVLMIPESIRRTYILLTLLRDEFKDSFISGAMLFYERKNIQHEDIGTLTKNCNFVSLKGRCFHEKLQENLRNESEFTNTSNEYAGWWYCCIPSSQIKKNGLSLPIFIRCDDMEYSLRCKAHILTMNGICVWHMGFTNKYNAAFDRYQQCRNLLIGKAVNSISNVNVFDFVHKSYRTELMRFNYDAAELVIKALEDYMKGPEFLISSDGEDIVNKNRKFNEILISLKEFSNIEVDLNAIYYDPPRTFLKKWIFRLTYNGQRFIPVSWLNQEPVAIAFDHVYQPAKMALHRNLLAVNPFTKQAAIRILDKQRYKNLQRRWRKNVRLYKKNNGIIEEEYAAKRAYITSVEFWKKYLGIL
ncbi:glycosyltransferase [Clostridium sp. Marseille-P2415]|uniref:glycosyltransferase n=1 Tax=Clostridium sp. Marseille-P2415 TaxID=1805471 RepID=UPI0009883832|nr:glycosyltransferase [Clostridium sp. Marseille-P2415]